MVNWQRIKQRFTKEQTRELRANDADFAAWIEGVTPKRNITFLDLSNYNWIGDLNLSSFPNLQKLDITNNPHLGKISNIGNKKNIIILNGSKEFEVFNAQNYLEENYPQEQRQGIEVLNLQNKNLAGDLDLAEFRSLKEVIITDNPVTKLPN